MAEPLSAEELATKLAAWFPWAKWECSMSGGYCCAWATVEVGRVSIGGFVFDRSVVSERVARARSWENARHQAKEWAWSPKLKPAPARDRGSDEGRSEG